MPEPTTTPTQDSSPPAEAEHDDAGSTPEPADLELGDAGKKALEAERKAARDATRKLKALEAELEQFRTAQLSESERAVAEARAAGRQEALAEANAKLAEATVTAAAAGKLRDPDLASVLLGDLAEFVAEDGNIDRERIAEAIDELLVQRPYLGVETMVPASKPAPPLPAGVVPGGAKAESSTQFRRSQLTDAAFYAANKDAILTAAREGRIVDDLS